MPWGQGRQGLEQGRVYTMTRSGTQYIREHGSLKSTQEGLEATGFSIVQQPCQLHLHC